MSWQWCFAPLVIAFHGNKQSPWECILDFQGMDPHFGVVCIILVDFYSLACEIYGLFFTGCELDQSYILALCKVFLAG